MTAELTESQQRRIEQLVSALRRYQLTGVGLLLARSLSSINIIVGNLLLFVQPLAPHERWRASIGEYAQLIEDPTSWQALIARLDAPDS